MGRPQSRQVWIERADRHRRAISFGDFRDGAPAAVAHPELAVHCRDPTVPSAFGSGFRLDHKRPGGLAGAGVVRRDALASVGSIAVMGPLPGDVQLAVQDGRLGLPLVARFPVDQEGFDPGLGPDRLKALVQLAQPDRAAAALAVVELAVDALDARVHGWRRRHPLIRRDLKAVPDAPFRRLGRGGQHLALRPDAPVRSNSSHPEFILGCRFEKDDVVEPLQDHRIDRLPIGLALLPAQHAPALDAVEAGIAQQIRLRGFGRNPHVVIPTRSFSDLIHQATHELNPFGKLERPGDRRPVVRRRQIARDQAVILPRRTDVAVDHQPRLAVLLFRTTVEELVLIAAGRMLVLRLLDEATAGVALRPVPLDPCGGGTAAALAGHDRRAVGPARRRAGSPLAGIPHGADLLVRLPGEHHAAVGLLRTGDRKRVGRSDCRNEPKLGDNNHR